MQAPDTFDEETPWDYLPITCPECETDFTEDLIPDDLVCTFCGFDMSERYA